MKAGPTLTPSRSHPAKAISTQPPLHPVVPTSTVSQPHPAAVPPPTPLRTHLVKAVSTPTPHPVKAAPTQTPPRSHLAKTTPPAQSVNNLSSFMIDVLNFHPRFLSRKLSRRLFTSPRASQSLFYHHIQLRLIEMCLIHQFKLTATPQSSLQSKSNS